MFVHHYDRTHDERGKAVQLSLDDESVSEQTLKELRSALRKCGIVLPDSANLSGGIENFLQLLTVAAENAGSDDDYADAVSAQAPVMMSLDGDGRPQLIQASKDEKTVNDFFRTLRR